MAKANIINIFRKNYKMPYFHMLNYVLARDFGIYLSKRVELKSGLIFNLVDYTGYMTINEAMNPHNYYHLDELPRIKPDVVLDIGANMGDFSIFASKHAGIVYAFEPVPEIYSVLLDNLSINKIDNVRTFPFALSGMTGDAKIIFDRKMSGMSKISMEADKNAQVVPTLSWSDLYKTIGDEIDVMKLDCEGGEYTLLDDPDILDHIKDIRCEIHVFDEKDIKRAKDFVALLYSHGFKCTCHSREALEACFGHPEKMEVFYFKKDG